MLGTARKSLELAFDDLPQVFADIISGKSFSKSSTSLPFFENEMLCSSLVSKTDEYDGLLLLLLTDEAEVFLLPMGVGYFGLTSSKKSCGLEKFFKSQIPSSFGVFNVIPCVSGGCDGCETVGQVVDEAELDDEALEIDDVVERNDDKFSPGRKLLKLLPTPAG